MIFKIYIERRNTGQPRQRIIIVKKVSNVENLTFGLVIKSIFAKKLSSTLINRAIAVQIPINQYQCCKISSISIMVSVE
jgi:hypothetical protein